MSSEPAGPTVLTRSMVHDLMNHLSTALGHSELIAMDLPATDPNAQWIIEIRDACLRAVQLVQGWGPPPHGQS